MRHIPRIAPVRTSGVEPPSRRAILVSWAQVVGGVAVASAIAAVEPTGLLRRNLAGVAALLFVLVPDRLLRARGEDWSAYGVPAWGLRDPRTWRAWGRGAAWGVAVSAVVLPAFVGGLLLALRATGHPVVLAPRIPDGLALAVATQLLVVAAPEELFYRGWVQTAWARRGPGRTVLGAPIGRGFLETQALFAAGHLVTLDPARLATFFPGLLFGWLRARTGGVAAPIVSHALSNLLVLFLRASLFA